mmetsp:Transcript_17687/g.23064  ORF Transcript_17687/g.23064 Transcript_17687/m.23064 type:complete len:268 (+) Transcript_17687:56-859(+)
MCRALVIEAFAGRSFGRIKNASASLATRRKLLSTTSSTTTTSFPYYLYGLFGAIGLGALGGTIVLVISCEPGLRESLEIVFPPAVQLIRERIGFADEDTVIRKERTLIEKQIYNDKVTVRSNDSSVLLDPYTSLSDACQLLNQVHHLALTVDDLTSDLVARENQVEEETNLPVVTPLESLITLNGAPSLWAEPPHIAASRQLNSRDTERALEQLQLQKRTLEDDLATGRRSIDDVRLELRAVENRRRELNNSLALARGGRTRWWWLW